MPEPVLTEAAIKRIADAPISGEHSLMAKEILRLRADVPAWHPKPTGPGRWLGSGGYYCEFSIDSLMPIRAIEGHQWYGPIPEPPTTTTGDRP